MRFTTAMAAATLGVAGFTHADVTEFDDKPEWVAAVGDFTTVDFTGFPDHTFITDQYLDQGILFLDGDDNTFGPSCGFATDRWGLDGNASVSVQFTTPMFWIGADFPGELVIQLFSRGDMVYESGDFACGLSCFGGLVSTEPFDLVVVFDPIGDDQVSPDNLHFGPAAPVPLDPIEDCNGNGFVDLCDTIWGTSFDCNENLIPDECEDPLPCAADVAEDDCAVDVSDLILVIQHWQWEESGADTNGDGVVDVLDLIQVITTWGPCGP